jgi:hypothetical protein
MAPLQQARCVRYRGSSSGGGRGRCHVDWRIHVVSWLGCIVRQASETYARARAVVCCGHLRNSCGDLPGAVDRRGSLKHTSDRSSWRAVQRTIRGGQYFGLEHAQLGPFLPHLASTAGSTRSSARALRRTMPPPTKPGNNTGNAPSTKWAEPIVHRASEAAFITLRAATPSLATWPQPAHTRVPPCHRSFILAA